jgi:hypothetical protein
MVIAKKIAAKKPASRKAASAAKPAVRKPVARTVVKSKKESRIRRTSRELFLDKLKHMSNEENPLITNQSLREELRWEEDKYKRIKRQLLDEGVIISGTGYSGRVGLSYGKAKSSLKVFISYSHVDEELKNNLLKHLNPLGRMGLISEWSDRKLLAGDEWAKEISKNLESADIIILLISIDFINSKYCYDIELERAIERHEKGEATVIPIILRNCMWQHMPFAKLQALPKEGKAVTSWTAPDDAFVNIAEGIRHRATEILADT